MKEKLHFKLNLFDTIIILLALGAAVFMLWNRFAPKGDGGATVAAGHTIQYTIRLRSTIPGTVDLVQPGDALEDAIKNFKIGNVISATAQPARAQAIDEENDKVNMAVVPDKEDIDIVVEAVATENEAHFLVGGGYEVRAGEQIWMRGPGYLGSGFIINVARNQED